MNYCAHKLYLFIKFKLFINGKNKMDNFVKNYPFYDKFQKLIGLFLSVNNITRFHQTDIIWYLQVVTHERPSCRDLLDPFSNKKSTLQHLVQSN